MWEANSITQKPQEFGHSKIALKMTILKAANSFATKIEEVCALVMHEFNIQKAISRR